MDTDVNPQGAAGSRDPSPDAVWQDALVELEHTLTKATFNRWLAGATLAEAAGDSWTIVVPNDQARDWLDNRYRAPIERTVSAVAGRPVALTFAVGVRPSQNGSGRDEEPEEIPKSEEAAAHELDVEFSGFDPIQSNFTLTPDLFFDHVVPKARPVVTKLVAAVIRQTIGTFEDKRHHRRREEWPANKAVVERIAGIYSRTSLLVALWDARQEGYIVLRPVEDPDERAVCEAKFGYPVEFTLRLRFADEPVDYPDRDRPEYGQPKQGPKRRH